MENRPIPIGRTIKAINSLSLSGFYLEENTTRTVKESGEKRLMVALVRDALFDFEKEERGSKKQRLAKQWLSSEDFSEWSFRWVLGHLVESPLGNSDFQKIKKRILNHEIDQWSISYMNVRADYKKSRKRK